MARVVLNNVTKVINENVIVKNISLDIPDKEFFILVGPSGCGKSTTLRMIAGLEEITEGDISIDGRVVNHVRAKDRDIAMVFQNYALYPHMTVYENMAFGLKLRALSRGKLARVSEAADISWASSTAGAQTQGAVGRTAPARGGGSRHRAQAQGVPVRRAAVQPGREDARADAHRDQQAARASSSTMIYVTHDQVEAMTMGDRIVVMKDGFIQQVAPPLELYDRPPTSLWPASSAARP
jgi:multiple sugar transport system ATP-binding protein